MSFLHKAQQEYLARTLRQKSIYKDIIDFIQDKLKGSDIKGNFFLIKGKVKGKLKSIFFLDLTSKFVEFHYIKVFILKFLY